MAAVTDEPQRRSVAAEVAKAVFWSFLGIRKRTEHEADAARITPVQVIIAGIDRSGAVRVRAGRGRRSLVV